MREGQGTLELLIALAIIIISVSAAIAVFFGGQSLLIDTQLSSEAYNLARGRLEEARSQARQNFGGLTSSSSTSGIFLKETIVSSIDTYTKRVTSRVSWQTDPLREQNVEAVAILTDWRNATPPPDPGDSGGGGISGDWQNPRTLGSVDLGPGNSATDLDVISKIVYLTSEASAASKPDFYVVNATDGQNPYVVSSLDVGVAGLIALDVSGSYAYAVEKNDHQLRVIDVSNQANPTVAASFLLPDAGGGKGLTIFYTGNKAYVGTTKDNDGKEFHIVDVSDPANPSNLGSREIGADVNKIYVSGNTVYLSTSADSSEVILLDVSNPSDITQISTFNATSTADGDSIYLVGIKLYLGRDSSSNTEFQILDVSSSTSMQSLGTADVGGDVNDMAVRDTLAFLGTSDSNNEFQVWNISDSANPTFLSSFNFPQVATGIDYEDNLVYVSVRSNDALRIITSNP